MKLLTLLSAIAGVQAVLFTPPKSFYKTTWTSEELVDESRLDPWNNTHPRRLMISRFKPIPAPLCLKTCRVPYMPPVIADIEDRILQAFFADAGWKAGTLSSLEVEVCCKTIPVPGLNSLFPKVFLATGLNTTRLTYTATAQHLASVGYEVIVMDHPYETDVVQFPNGELIFGGNIVGQRNNSVKLAYGLTIRSADTSFVMDKFKMRKTTFIGQSYGGAAAADILVRDKRVAGGVNMDGAMYGPGAENGVDRPFMIMGSDGHNSSIESEPTWTPFVKAMEDKHPNVFFREFSMEDSTHGSWTDSSLICDIVPGLKENEALADFCGGKATGDRAMEIMKHYLKQFIEFTLHHAPEGDLSHPNPKYPDMTIIT